MNVWNIVPIWGGILGNYHGLFYFPFFLRLFSFIHARFLYSLMCRVAKNTGLVKYCSYMGRYTRELSVSFIFLSYFVFFFHPCTFLLFFLQCTMYRVAKNTWTCEIYCSYGEVYSGTFSLFYFPLSFLLFSFIHARFFYSFFNLHCTGWPKIHERVKYCSYTGRYTQELSVSFFFLSSFVFFSFIHARFF